MDVRSRPGGVVARRGVLDERAKRTAMISPKAMERGTVRRHVWAGVSALLLVGFAGSCYAHKPVSIGETFGAAERALVLEEVDTSQVVYAALTSDESQLWLTFEAEEPTDLHLSLGIPAIERLGGYRPWIAVLGPGLPEIELPISMPAGSGGLAFRGSAPGDDALFFEPFTGTESWITVKETVALPEAGRYYVAAWAAREEADKLWVAVGVRERFGLRDVLSLPSIGRGVRAFHEVAERRALIPWESVLVLALIAGAIGRALLR
jgi:hypothetical protein